MGIESREITIDARAGHDGSSTGGNYGSYAIIYASREGLAEVETVENYHKSSEGTLRYHERRFVVRISWDPDSFTVNDYIVVHNKRSANPHLRGSSSRESFELLAGTIPPWASFPKLWKEYVQKNESRAIDALYDLAYHLKNQELVGKLDFARRKSSKSNIESAWRDFQSACERKGLLKYIPEHRYSWTGVQAMPIKIAKAIKKEIWKGSEIDLSFLDEAPSTKSIEPEGVIIAKP